MDDDGGDRLALCMLSMLVCAQGPLPLQAFTQTIASAFGGTAAWPSPAPGFSHVPPPADPEAEEAVSVLSDSAAIDGLGVEAPPSVVAIDSVVDQARALLRAWDGVVSIDSCDVVVLTNPVAVSWAVTSEAADPDLGHWLLSSMCAQVLGLADGGRLRLREAALAAVTSARSSPDRYHATALGLLASYAIAHAPLHAALCGEQGAAKSWLCSTDYLYCRFAASGGARLYRDYSRALRDVEAATSRSRGSVRRAGSSLFVAPQPSPASLHAPSPLPMTRHSSVTSQCGAAVDPVLEPDCVQGLCVL